MCIRDSAMTEGEEAEGSTTGGSSEEGSPADESLASSGMSWSVTVSFVRHFSAGRLHGDIVVGVVIYSTRKTTCCESRLTPASVRIR